MAALTMMMNDNSFNPYGLRDGEMSSGVSRQLLLLIITKIIITCKIDNNHGCNI